MSFIALPITGGGGSSSNSFTIIQTPSGTSPTATTSTSTLNLTSSDGTVSIIGNSGTNTVDLKASGLSISGTDNSVVRVDGTTAIQGSGILIDDVASSTVNLRPSSGNNLVISTDGTKTSPGGGWIDLWTGAGTRMRFLNASYDASIGAVEWSNLRVLHRIPVTFVDDTVSIGKRNDGTLERPQWIYLSVGINAPNLSVYADNAAATTGGLAVGSFYRTSTGQLMVRY